MSVTLLWQVGNRNPSIFENIVDTNGVAIDLSSSTVRFKMRARNSTTLKVDQPAVIVAPASGGNVRYDWAAVDVDTAGFYLAWWEVTTAGKTQDVGEALIEFRAHAPQTNAYIEVESLKSTLQLTGSSFAEQDIQTAIVAASRGIDDAAHRRFYPDIDANQVRYYSACPKDYSLEIDDLITLTSVTVDTDANGTYESTWAVDTDFVLEPYNAPADGFPYERLCRHPNSSVYFPPYPKSVKITGKFGFASIPPEVTQMTTIIATRLLKRAREAAFGVVSIGLEGEATRLAKNDPDLKFLLDRVTRDQVIA